jgi:hypothetical protein
LKMILVKPRRAVIMKAFYHFHFLQGQRINGFSAGI